MKAYETGMSKQHEKPWNNKNVILLSENWKKLIENCRIEGYILPQVVIFISHYQ